MVRMLSAKLPDTGIASSLNLNDGALWERATQSQWQVRSQRKHLLDLWPVASVHWPRLPRYFWAAEDLRHYNSMAPILNPIKAGGRIVTEFVFLFNFEYSIAVYDTPHTLIMAQLYRYEVDSRKLVVFCLTITQSTSTVFHISCWKIVRRATQAWYNPFGEVWAWLTTVQNWVILVRPRKPFCGLLGNGWVAHLHGSQKSRGEDE